jgi:hypothetical protein
MSFAARETEISCSSDHCVTCADEAKAMLVLEIGPGTARCADDDGNIVEVMTDLVAGIKNQDRVLVHAGVALALAESPGDFRR